MTFFSCAFPHFAPFVIVQQKDSPQGSSSAQVTSASSTSGDLQIPTVSADVAADIAKYTNKVIIFTFDLFKWKAWVDAFCFGIASD